MKVCDDCDACVYKRGSLAQLCASGGRKWEPKSRYDHVAFRKRCSLNNYGQRHRMIQAAGGR